MFPAATAAPFARNVVRRGIFFLFFAVFKSCYVFSRSITVSVTGRGGKSRRLQGALRFGPRSTTDASTFPPGPSRSDRVPHVSHVLSRLSVAAPGGGGHGGQMPPQLEALPPPPTCPPSQNGIFFFFFFFTYVVSHTSHQFKINISIFCNISFYK